jgi:hypothetical protein
VTPDEEYRLFLDQIHRLTDRRQTVTTAYLTVNAAIVGALAFLFKEGYMPGWPQQASALALFAAGLVACDLWRRLILQYSTLLDWWYEQLRALEERVSECSGLIGKEYAELYGGGQGGSRVGLTRYQIGLTWLFTAIYGIFALSILVTWVLMA